MTPVKLVFSEVHGCTSLNEQRSRYTHPALLQRDGIDARSVQKIPAGTVKNVRPVHFLPTCLLRKHAAAWNHRPSMAVLIRRRLICSQQQSRYAVYLQKTSRHEKVETSDTQGKSAFDYRFRTVR